MLLKSIEESRLAISECELANCDHGSHSLSMMQSLKSLEVDEKNREAVVANDVVVSIVAGMSRENKQILKDTVLLSSLVANKRFPGGGVSWYNEFRSMMSYCGWVSQTRDMSNYKTDNSSFTMEQEGIRILASAITAMAVPTKTAELMLKVAKDTLEVLQGSEKPLRLFESSSKTHDGAKFAIASSVESPDGEVLIGLGAVDFTTSLKVTNVLFWEWNSSSVAIKRAEGHMFLNHRHFKEMEPDIMSKLTEGPRKALMEIPDL